jgi:hypothetical protein
MPNLTEMKLLRGLLSFIQTGQSLAKNFYSKMSAYSDSFYMPTLNGLAEASIMEIETESVFAGKQYLILTLRRLVHHVNELCNLSNKPTAPNKILDVYKYSDPAAVLNCVEKISSLRAKILVNKEEFPENTILNELLHSVDLFMNIPCDSPQMYFASSLEKLLGILILVSSNNPPNF